MENAPLSRHGTWMPPTRTRRARALPRFRASVLRQHGVCLSHSLIKLCQNHLCPLPTLRIPRHRARSVARPDPSSSSQHMDVIADWFLHRTPAPHAHVLARYTHPQFLHYHRNQADSISVIKNACGGLIPWLWKPKKGYICQSTPKFDWKFFTILFQ